MLATSASHACALAAESGELEARLRCLKVVLQADDASAVLPAPQFWSTPLQRTLLPRHAYLVKRGLPHGPALLEASCEQLLRMVLLPKGDREFARVLAGGGDAVAVTSIEDDFAAFAASFRAGGIDAARVGDSALLAALSAHGWSAACERDRRGASALHYAAGRGFVACCDLLTADGELSVNDRAATDGATPLHWAVAGVTSRRRGTEPNGFGVGGHPQTAKWLVEHGADARAVTCDGNSILHWAAWAGGLPTVQWLCEHARLDVEAVNRHGCTAALWAASGGDLSVCQYLAAECGADFARSNQEGNTPLSKAVAHCREDVVRWLLDTQPLDAEDIEKSSGIAARLAVRRAESASQRRIDLAVARARVPVPDTAARASSRAGRPAAGA